MEIRREPPEGVDLSPHLVERAAFYIVVMLDGISYYIAATPEVRRMLRLNVHGYPATPKQRRAWREASDNESALRDVLSSIHLQLRDVVLAGIEENVKQALLRKMERAMSATVRASVNEAQKLLQR